MPKLPSFLLPTEGISTAQNAPSMRGISAQAFNTQAEGLGDLAKGILSISPLFEKYAHEVQGMENSRTISEARTTLAAQAAELQNSLMLDNDPASHVAKTSEFIARQREAIEQANYTPAAREAIAQHFTEFSTSFQINNAKNAALLSERRTKLQLDNELSLATQNRDHAQFQSILTQAEQNGTILPEEKVAAENAYKTKTEEQDITNSIFSNPSKFLQDNPPESISTAKDPAKQYQNIQTAKKLINGQINDAATTIQDGMASGKITTLDQLNAATATLPPRAQEEFRNDFLARQERIRTGQEAAHQAKLASPEGQAAAYGAFMAAANNYDGHKQDGFDSDTARLNQLANQIIDPAIKQEAKDLIKRKQDGAAAITKTYAELGESKLNQLHKTGQFGSPDAKTKTAGTFYQDGILINKDALIRYGLTPEQANQVATANNTLSADDSGEQDQKIRDTNNKSRLAIFQQIRSHMTNAGIGADKVTASALEALYQNKMSEGIVVDTAAQESANKRYGEALIAYRTFIKTHPNASEKEINDQLYNITKTTSSPTASRKIVDEFQEPQQPTQKQMNLAPSSTKITSFGYSADPHADDNSAIGIAAFTDSKDEQALKQSNGKANVPTRLQPNDIAVSPDVEKQFRANGIKPRDYVTVTLKDGSQITGRWMDKTAANLTGRIDLYSPNGTHPKDDSPVISWQPARATNTAQNLPTPITEADINPENPLLPPLNDAQIPSL